MKRLSHRSPLTGIFLFLLVAVLFGWQLSTHDWHRQSSILISWEWWKWGLCLFCTAANWLLEASRWHYLLSRSVCSTSFADALKGVLAGQALGFISFKGIGDMAGRLIFLPFHVKRSAVVAFFQNQWVQFSVSIAAGVSGTFYFFTTHGSFFALASGGLVLAALAILGRFAVKLSVRFTCSVRVNKWISKIVPSESVLPNELHWQVWALAIARYATFLLQFYFVFQFLNVDLPSQLLLAGISTVLLAKTLLPAFHFLGDLGVRELAAFTVFSQAGAYAEAAMLAGLIVWVFNLLIPSLCGALFFWQYRFRIDPAL